MHNKPFSKKPRTIQEEIKDFYVGSRKDSVEITQQAAVHVVYEMLMKVEGEKLTGDLAAERARNIVAAFYNVTIKG